MIGMKFLLAPIFTLILGSVHAQQNHFIYIQSDNRQAFYVKQDKKIMSSTQAGYLIIPKLKTGNYDFFIGFPKNEWPEQKISCTVGETDLGYQLKNLGEKGWGLFNFQTMELLLADNSYKKDSATAQAKEKDVFTDMLSKVVNDPGINAVEEKKEVTVTDTQLVVKPVDPAATKKKTTKVKAAGNQKAGVTKRRKVDKLSETKSSDSLSLTYVDRYKGKPDTIRLVMPFTDTAAGSPVAANPVDTIVSIVPPIVKNETPVLDTVKTTLVETMVDASVTTILKNPIPVTEAAKDTIAMNSRNPVDSSMAAPNNSIAVIQPVLDSTNQTGVEKKPDESMTTIVRDTKTDPLKDTVAVVTNMATSVDSIAKQQPVVSMKLPETSDSLSRAVVKAEIPVDTALISLAVKNQVTETRQAPLTDTIIIAPVQEKIPVDTIAVSKPVIERKVADPVTDNTVQELKKEPAKPIQTLSPPVIEKPVTNSVASTPKPVTRPSLNCTVYADDDEYLNLRKKMEKNSDNENQMLSIAHKLFEKRCFNTLQVKRLSLLFQTDAGKYKLFDDAYNYTYDAEKFPTLISELTDDYYRRRFKAMLR